jgi:hypothetical protein
MKEYIFLRINENFRNLFFDDNLNAFLELYYRRDESVFYKEQFSFFLVKNKQKEIINYLKGKLNNRNELVIENSRILLTNNFNDSKEILELRDNYLLLKSDFNKSVFSKYLSEYDSDFLVIDINKRMIEKLAMVN